MDNFVQDVYCLTHAKVQGLISQLLRHIGVTWKYTFCTMLKFCLLLWYLFISLSQVSFFIKTAFAELGYVVSFLGPLILCISFNYCQTIFTVSVERKTHEISIKSIIFCKNIFTSKNTFVKYSPSQRLQRQSEYGNKKGTVRPQSQFNIHVSVSVSYIPWVGLPILLQENMWTDSGNI
jgi:hypothetical protein